MLTKNNYKFYLKLYVIDTKKIFKKYFDTEFERDKFQRKLKYSKKLIAIGKGMANNVGI